MFFQDLVVSDYLYIGYVIIIVFVAIVSD